MGLSRRRPAMRSAVGSSGVAVTWLGLGAAPIGNLYRSVPDDIAGATVAAAWRFGIRYFDTAPHYGLGLSERRLGRALAHYPRDSYVLSTKVGRVLEPVPARGRTDRANGFDVPATHRRVWDFTADGVRRSLDDSLLRLALDRVDLVLLHDPEESPDPDAAIRVGYPAVHELRRQGVVGAIGVGSKDVATLARFVLESDVDAVMVAGRYTLLEQPALDVVMPECQRRGISVLNAGIFNSGLLAVDRPDDTRTYEYAAVPDAILRRAQRIASVCGRHGVGLPRAALAFAAAHPAVASVVVGADAPDQITDSAQWLAETAPPSQMWTELVAEGLLRPDAPVPTP